MSKQIHTGATIELKTRVKESDTARVHGSGLLDVYSTPAMVAFMEKASMDLVGPLLDEGQGTVGISLDIRHMMAVPVGEEISCKSTLSGRDGNRLTFDVRVYKGSDIVGEGIHKRYIIDEERFLSKIGR
ncbi:MAG: thioesterase family protein [Bacteroidales bacterium]|nr:thioesterase family protein [Bacteroidales bacterium]